MSGDTTRTGWRATRLVAMRELREGLRNRTLTITFVVMVIGIVAGAFVPLLFGGDDATTLAVIDTVEVDDEVLERAAGTAEIDLDLRRLPTEEAAVAAVDDGEVDLALAGSARAPELIVEQDADPALRAVIADVLARGAVDQGLQELAADARQQAVEALAAAPELTVRALDRPDDPGAIPLAFVSTLFLFVAVTFFASRVLTGVVEEKSSRVVEVVLGAMRPEHLLAGKLIGIGALAFGQVLALVVVAVVSVTVSGAIDLPSTAVASGLAMVGWFALGFASYSAVYAAAGALVSRVEDAQSSAGPIGILLFIAYFGTFSVVVPSPDGTASRIMSQIPGIAPLAMPARIALGAVSPVEVVLAVLLSLAAIYGAVRLAGAIYRRSILRTQKATWREALARSPAG